MSATTDLQKLETKETLPTEIEKCILYCSDKQRYDVNYIDAILAATELADKDAQIAALRARVEASISPEELAHALGKEYNNAKSTSFYLMLVKQYRLYYEAGKKP